MKYLIFIVAIFLLPLIACNFPATTISKDNSAVSETTSHFNEIGNTGKDRQESNRKFDLGRAELKNPMIWAGDISVEDEKVISRDNVIWSNDELDKVLDKSEIGTKIEVDIMNCAGYLGSGNISYLSKIEDTVPEWKVSIIPETIAKDAIEKVKQCDGEPDSTGKFISSSAFAIAPRNNNRRNIKINKINTEQLFASLPKDTKKWLNNKFALDAGRRKNDLSLRFDNWTDIDGDGKIDLIMLSAAYNDESDSGIGIMLLINGIWKDIGSIKML
ncbi:MAG: hypothetical protein ACR2HG_08230 [Pyrinomonadaceae bacterium]